jgi:hypothetical protein
MRGRVGSSVGVVPRERIGVAAGIFTLRVAGEGAARALACILLAGLF